MNRLRGILAGKAADITATLIAIIAINCWQQVLTNLTDDPSYSIAAAGNLAAGHGYSLTMPSLQDLSVAVYEPLNKWPPGYSWLLFLVQKLTGLSWLRSVYLLNGAAVTFLVLIFRKMLLQLEISAWLIPVATIWFGFTLHAFLIGFTDLMGILFFSAGLSMLLYYVRSEKKRVWLIILAALSFVFCAYLKYLYLALSFIPLICLYIYGFKQRQRNIRQSALIGFFIVLLFTAGLLLFQRHYAGHAVYIHPTRAGFFPEQLPWTGPMVIDKIMNLNFYTLQAELYTHFSYIDISKVWGGLNVICLIWMIFITVSFIRKGKLMQKSPRSFYAFTAFSVSATLVILLGFLTVRMNRYYDSRTKDWIYGAESRYYAVLGLFIFQFTAYLFLSARRFFGGTGAVIFRVLIVLVIGESILHGTYYFIKKIEIEKNFGIHRHSEQLCLEAVAQVEKLMQRSGTKVVCSNAEMVTNFCRLMGIASIYDIQLNGQPLRSSKPVLLITIIDTKQAFLIPDYFKTVPVKLEYVGNGVYYFTSRIPQTVIP
jgi:hypothetical protein